MGFDLGWVSFGCDVVCLQCEWSVRFEFGQCQLFLVVGELLQLGCVVCELVGLGDVFG